MSKPSMTCEMSEGDAAILAVILACGTTGMSKAAIAGRAGRTEVATDKAMRRLRDRGLIEATVAQGGQRTRWGAPGTAAAYASDKAAAVRRMSDARRKREVRHGAADAWIEPVRYPSVWAYAASVGGEA